MTFYFFDLETSGFSAKTDRIMQFGGQRTDSELKLIGQPDNLLVKMTPDILPEPGAILVHGIAPQRTLAEGLTEAEFCEFLIDKVAIKDTVMVGFNNIRFDNDFIRYILWRNFHDPYEWSWKNGCSTWDLLDVARMTRALRPEGIKWPYAPDGTPSNRLEYLSSINKLEHDDAHDAVADVKASIALARLIRNKQPKLFDYLLRMRQKPKVAPFIAKGDSVVYTSGRYPAEFERTTVAVMAAEKADKTGALMYDLRIDPDEFKDLAVAELVKRWNDRSENAPYFPVKELRYNRCPAVAPLSVLDESSYQRLQLHPETINSHLKKLRAAKGFGDKLLEAQAARWPEQPQLITDAQSVDGQLYDGFIKDEDRPKMSVVRAAGPEDIKSLDLDFSDERLQALFPLYKARNFPASLNPDELKTWNDFRRQKLLVGGEQSRAKYFLGQIEGLSQTPGVGEEKQALLKELKDYSASVLPKD